MYIHLCVCLWAHMKTHRTTHTSVSKLLIIYNISGLNMWKVGKKISKDKLYQTVSDSQKHHTTDSCRIKSFSHPLNQMNGSIGKDNGQGHLLWLTDTHSAFWLLEYRRYWCFLSTLFPILTPFCYPGTHVPSLSLASCFSASWSLTSSCGDMDSVLEERLYV